MTFLRLAAPAGQALAALAMLVGTAADPAAAAVYNPSALSPDRLAQVQQLCESNLHLRPGESHFDGCVEGLSSSLANAGRAAAVHSAREACFAAWPNPGAPERAECLLDATEGRAASPTAISTRSYFHASAADIRRGEQLACARLGFDPIGGAFEGCVADLAGALEAADRPAD